jgi:cold shock CspA family protein
MNRLIKIGVFYDGNFFSHVSNYYSYHHPRKQRISISGLHEYIRHRVATTEQVELHLCRIVDSHYFRGRLSADEAQNRNLLYFERLFDHILMSEGVVTHYLPLSNSGEKGIDVWLALEAYELALFKKFNVAVLIAADGDYVPLVRKLNALGVCVMVLGWDFEFTTEDGRVRETKTSQKLLGEATYPILMSRVIDDPASQDSELVEGLFVRKREKSRTRRELDLKTGRIKALKEGYGFIKQDDGGPDCFFHWTDVGDFDFNELAEGMAVKFKVEQSEKGPAARNVTPEATER